MAKKRKSKARRRKRSSKAKIKTGGALAPAKCKAGFKACMRAPAPIGAGKQAKACLKRFNDCRL